MNEVLIELDSNNREIHYRYNDFEYWKKYIGNYIYFRNSKGLEYWKGESSNFYYFRYTDFLNKYMVK